jgi:hypothetical protein
MHDELVTWLRALLDRQEAALIALRDHRAGLTPCINYEGQDPADYDRYDSCSEHLRLSAAVDYRDPEFGLAEVKTNLRILDLHVQRPEGECDACNERQYGEPCPTVRLLAQPYAGRAGWRDEWRSQ